MCSDRKGRRKSRIQKPEAEAEDSVGKYRCLELGSLAFATELGLSGRAGRQGRSELGSTIHEFGRMECDASVKAGAEDRICCPWWLT